MQILNLIPNVLSKAIPIIFSFAGLGLLITVHEFGHFFFCKVFGVNTPTFSIGFGPEIFRRKIGQTDFRLAIIPFGGYVEIAGMAEVGQGEQEHANDTGDNSFANKWYWQKFFILVGGILFNLLFAYTIFCGMFLIGSSSKDKGIKVANIVKDSAAAKYGLKEEDKILGINDLKLDFENEETLLDQRQNLLSEIRLNPNKEVTLFVKRANEDLALKIVLASKPDDDGKEFGILGAYFDAPMPRLPFFKAIKTGIEYTNQLIVGLILGIKKLISSRSLEGTMGPVMILSQGAAVAKSGILAFLIFLAMLSISLAVMNILPIGALDGGQLLFVTIEAIIRRKIPETIKLVINLASWILIVSLAVYLSFKELRVLFGKNIESLFGKILGLFK
ncbi:MAG: Membrane-associated zinc metalloprotease [candidate division TM6 bacterium GW2011_GWF2_37_49]|nr:MAG: Membrane-associated zinc metalloprotease [candidate division TM6 bacterium GW2011_GWF2_37_49]